METVNPNSQTNSTLDFALPLNDFLRLESQAQKGEINPKILPEIEAVLRNPLVPVDVLHPSERDPKMYIRVGGVQYQRYEIIDEESARQAVASTIAKVMGLRYHELPTPQSKYFNDIPDELKLHYLMTYIRRDRLIQAISVFILSAKAADTLGKEELLERNLGRVGLSEVDDGSELYNLIVQIFNNKHFTDEYVDKIIEESDTKTLRGFDVLIDKHGNSIILTELNRRVIMNYLISKGLIEDIELLQRQIGLDPNAPENSLSGDPINLVDYDIMFQLDEGYKSTYAYNAYKWPLFENTKDSYIKSWKKKFSNFKETLLNVLGRRL